ncbi:MAG TPA: glycosyltransferase family 4 protein [Chloroflexia bacterium]|nr:glycosyltransferase family 4 protein [Chloroflexia bacterium]
MAHYVFIYPQIKRLTGAQRLILALAGAIEQLPEHPAHITLLTHHFAAECRPALPGEVSLIETGRNLNLTGNHYLDSLTEYASIPFLLPHLPVDTSAICFFGPPSLPGLWWARKILRLKLPLLYFCYEPPRAAYTDTREVSRRMGKLGLLAQPFFRLYRPVDRYLAQQSDVVLVNGEYGQKLIRETYERLSTIITHGAELEIPDDICRKAALVRERFALADRPVIITVNHLHPRKRIDVLIRAMPAILAEHPDTALLIVGKGPEEAALRTLSEELGLNDKQVIFAGFVPDAELAAYYAASTLYAHSGRAETFGLSILEASMSGLPVVAANEGGPREILEDGQTGFLIDAIPANFASKINWLLAHPEEMKKMGQANASRVKQKYTWERGAQNFLEALYYPAKAPQSS